MTTPVRALGEGMKTGFFVTLVVLLCAGSALGQGRIEIQPFVGYRFGGTVPVTSEAGSALDINKIQFKSGLAYGLTVGTDLTEMLGAEFLWNRQQTQAVGKLNGGGEFPQRIDANLDQYQGNLLIHLAERDRSLRPYVLVGLGATRGSGAESSITKFSWAIGGGLKYFFTENMGVRMQMRYAPTYLYSTAGGVWCNWWGVCWVVPNNKFLNQGDATAGWTFRF